MPWINNEYNVYTGKRGVCSFCCISLPAEKLVQVDPTAVSVINRFARSCNIMPFSESALMCKDKAECDKWIAKKLEQATGYGS
jgi:hypothetical protein